MHLYYLTYIVSLYSFLLGSIPFGFVVSKLYGINIRKEGSGNIGATNVWRCIGPKYGFAVFLLDGLKGIFAIYLTSIIHPDAIPLAFLCSVIGHMSSPFLGFKGGKGVAIIFFTLLLLDFNKALMFALVWLSTLALTRYVSLSSIFGMTYIVLSASYKLLSTKHNYISENIALAEIIAAYTSIFMHKSNITRILQHKETEASFTKVKGKLSKLLNLKIQEGRQKNSSRDSSKDSGCDIINIFNLQKGEGGRKKL